MRKKNIVVLVSGGGTNLQSLIDAQRRGSLKNARIAAVISSSPDAYALTRAKKAGIFHQTLDRKQYADRSSFARELAGQVRAHRPDLIVLAGFLCILPAEFCREFENKIINVHPSLIPSFCGDGYYGLRVHEEVLKTGVKVTGATVHFVNEITDGGEIILQKAVKVLEKDTPQSLQKRVMKLAEQVLLRKAVCMLCEEKDSTDNNRDLREGRAFPGASISRIRIPRSGERCAAEKGFASRRRTQRSNGSKITVYAAKGEL